ncbi:EF-hand domain-containing protein [Pseudonocardiaceae bacterium YIM PH 21723]|nr:EF-hand domain-containing protein [Pseudonocardiaceae bacterium YIM PH 21723]
MHELVRAKLARRFALLDFEGRGHLTRGDFDRMAWRLVEATGDTSLSGRLLENYRHGWAQLTSALGRDIDSTLSEEEFARAWSDLVGRRGFDTVVRPIVEAVFTVLDANGDGRLSGDEFAHWLRAYGVVGEDATLAFGRLDRDHDGLITRAELLAAFLEFFGSTLPTAPGNWLYGPFDVLSPI